MTPPVPEPRMETIALREAKANLSRLTRQAREGMRVVITNHGTPIADLVQHGAGSAPLIRLKHPGALPGAMRLQGEGPMASELLLADREF